MKKFLSILLILTLTFSMVSCSKTENAVSTSKSEGSTTEEENEVVEEMGIRPVHIKETSYYFSGSTYADDIYYRPAYLTISKPLLEDSDRELFPELAKVFEDNAKDLSNVAKERFNKLLLDGSYLVEAGNEYQSVSEEDTLHVMRADSNAVSLATFATMHQGGAHGDYIVVSENYDTKTGEMIKFTDVVKDTDAFFEQVDVALSNQYRDIYEELKPVMEYVSGIDLDRDLIWWMTNEGVCVYFSYYELAGFYAGGSQTVSVSFSENKELFNEKYMETLEDFVYPVDAFSYPGFVDGDSNGSFEYIYFEPMYSEDDYGEMGIYLNGQGKTIEIGYNEPEMFIVKKSGTYYLYLFCHYDNDYVIGKGINLSNMEELDYMDSDGLANEWFSEDTIDSEEEVGGLTYNVYGSHNVIHHISDPDSMFMNVHMDLLGTWNGISEYAVDDGGVARRKPANFVRESATVLKLLQDVNCVSVDEDGNNLTTETLKSGTYLMMRRTDGENYVDFLVINPEDVSEESSEYYTNITFKEGKGPDKNGTLYRMKIEKRDYLHNVEGIPEEELLAGMLYAG